MLFRSLAGQQAVDQASAEGVAAANAVDDVQVVLLGEAVLVGSNIVQHSAPAVVECAVALTQSDSDLLEVELVSQLLGNALVALSVQLAAVDIGSLMKRSLQDSQPEVFLLQFQSLSYISFL